jgi:hypothetical protein
MQALGDELTRWHEFYTLLGTAAGTLVGLLFVVATVSSGIFSLDRRAPLRVFLSATVVHFSSVLVVSLIMLLPLGSWPLAGAMVLACGLVGLGYSGLAVRDSIRDGLIANIDWEDRTWYGVLPLVAYLAEAAAGIALACGAAAGCTLLTACMGLLLVVGIHNSGTSRCGPSRGSRGEAMGITGCLQFALTLARTQMCMISRSYTHRGRYAHEHRHRRRVAEGGDARDRAVDQACNG